MKIVFWSDFACPFCYIGETRLKKAIAEILSDASVSPDLSFELEMRAFRLEPEADTVPESDTVTRYAKKYRMSPMLAQHQVEKISNSGRREGLVFNYGGTLSVNTFDAHRLTKLAYSKDTETADAIIEALFKAYFADNKVLSDSEVLTEIGTQAGLEENEIREMLSSDKFSREVWADEEEAREKGISGVPYFEIDGSVQINGAEMTEGFKHHILKLLNPGENASSGNDDDTKLKEGHTCGPDGCKL